MMRKCYSVSRSSIDENNDSTQQTLDCFLPQNCRETYFCGGILRRKIFTILLLPLLTSRAEVFLPGNLPWHTLAWRPHCLIGQWLHFVSLYRQRNKMQPWQVVSKYNLLPSVQI